MSTFFFPCQFLGFKENTHLYANYGITARKYKFSIFDASYMATKHNLETCYQSMEIFFHRVYSEIYITEAENEVEAKNNVEILRAGLVINGAMNFPMPYISNTSMEKYCSINERSSEILRDKLPDYIKAFEVPDPGTISISDYENHYSYMMFSGINAIDSNFFDTSVDIAKVWQELEGGNHRIKLARKAISIAPTIKDSGMCLLQIWQGIESLFNHQQELSFRVSLLLSLLLGDERKQTYDASRASYTIRSKVAHGSLADVSDEQLESAWCLLFKGMHAIVRKGRLPKEDELMSELF